MYTIAPLGYGSAKIIRNDLEKKRGKGNNIYHCMHASVLKQSTCIHVAFPTGVAREIGTLVLLYTATSLVLAHAPLGPKEEILISFAPF